MRAIRYDAIVIGAGPGGSCCAALLADAGLKTLLVEKNGYVGGKAGTVEQHSHRSDIFTHIPVLSMGRKGHIRRALELLDVAGELQLVEDMPPTLVCYEDVSVEYPADYMGGDSALLAKIGLELEGPEQVISQGLRLFLDTLSGFKPENIEEMRNLPLGPMLSSLPPALKNAADIATLLLFVVSAKYASAGETLEIFRRIYEDVTPPLVSLKQAADASMAVMSYPKGGIGKVSEAFVESFRRNGGRLELSREAEGIEVDGGRVKGIRVGGEYHQADVVVSNAGIQPTVLKLVGEEHFPPEYLDGVKSLRPSFGSARIKYFLDRQLIPYGLVVPYGGEGSAAGEDATGRRSEGQGGKGDRSRPARVGTMIVSPSNFDPSMSPPGKQVVIASCAATADYRFDNRKAEEWFKMIHSTVEKVIPGIGEHAEHVEYATSDFIARLSGRYGVLDGVGGECIGIAQVPGQVGVDRPQPASPIDGLFVVGADTGRSGIGVDLAVGSGIDVADLVGEYLS